MRVLRKWWLLLICLLPALSVAGDNFPSQQTFANQTLVLNGKGVRTKAVFDLYTAGLYLKEKTNNANDVLTSTQPMAMRLEITSSMITSDNMEEAVRDGFKKSSSNPALQPRIEQLIAVFKKPIKKGDVYDFVSTGSTVNIVKNGAGASSIAGADFKQAFYGIWLGTNPVQGSLKKALLSN